MPVLNKEKDKTMRWISLDEAIRTIKKIKGFDWFHDFSLKYIAIHIDTRNRQCILLNRNHKVITQEQYDMLKNK